MLNCVRRSCSGTASLRILLREGSAGSERYRSSPYTAPEWSESSGSCQLLCYALVDSAVVWPRFFHKMTLFSTENFFSYLENDQPFSGQIHNFLRFSQEKQARISFFYPFSPMIEAWFSENAILFSLENILLLSENNQHFSLEFLKSNRFYQKNLRLDTHFKSYFHGLKELFSKTTNSFSSENFFTILENNAPRYSTPIM